MLITTLGLYLNISNYLFVKIKSPLNKQINQIICLAEDYRSKLS